MNDLAAVGLSAVAWCFWHSFFVTHRWRDLVHRYLPRWHVFSRIVYVTCATATVGGLFLWWQSLPARLLWDWPGWWSWVRVLGLAEAGFLFWQGSRAYDGKAFLGLRQLIDYAAGRTASPPPFRSDGILGVVRHPWYAGSFVLLVFCLPFTDVNLVWRGVFFAYTAIGTELEERKLLGELGEEYAEYRQRVPRFVPWRSTRKRDS